MERLRSAEYRGEGLDGHTRDVVHGLLRRKGNACRLGVEAHQTGTGILGAESVFHGAIPDFARRPILGDLFEEVVVGIKEKAEPRTEFVRIQATPLRPLNIFHAVIKREG